jgi:hypothetical protein
LKSFGLEMLSADINTAGLGARAYATFSILSSSLERSSDMKKGFGLTRLMVTGLFTVSVLSAQGVGERDAVPLKNWDAPMYWQPSVVESKDAAARQIMAGNSDVDRASSITPQAQTPANSLVFVGMTPCRVVDTRTGSGFTGAFGPPSLVGAATRTFPIQSSSTCSIPAIAQAYSFNITLVSFSFVDFITVWPTGQPRPTASTLNGYVQTVIANAAVVPAGTSGSVDVFASQNTDLIIDINGYYAPQSGITLTQGTAAAPSLSFAGDPGTGMFSSAGGTLNIATGGVSRLTVASNGHLTVGGNVTFESGASPILYTSNAGGEQNRYLQLINSPFFESASGLKAGGVLVSDSYAFANPGKNDLIVKGNVGVGTGAPTSKVEIAAQDGLKISGFQPFVTLNDTNTNKPAFMQGVDGDAVLLTNTRAALVLKDVTGRVGIGTITPGAGLDVQVSGGYAVIGQSASGPGVYGSSTNSPGVQGSSVSGSGVTAFSNTNTALFASSISGIGVRGHSSSNWAGYFEGNVHATGTVTWTSDGRLKRNVANLGYGLSEVLQLRPVTYRWKDKPERGQQLGFIAQEVESVLPELVSTDKDAEQTKGLNYVGLVPVTIKAIQEQQAKIDQQQRQIEELKQLVCLDHPEARVCK